MQFTDLRLAQPLMRAVRTEGYTTPTPVQREAIPHVLDGRDLIGCAQTGTGKTAAFALPILHHLLGDAPTAHRRYVPVRALVLTPTRELALQVGESFATYGQYTKLKHATVYGGVKQGRQVNALKRGVDIVVATPGRLLDLLNQNVFDLRAVERFILDEADRMLDMGFLPDIKRVIAQLPAERQTLLFSATMPKEIEELAESLLRDPVRVSVAPARSAAADTVEQSLYFVHPAGKTRLLEHLLRDRDITKALVFARTKRRADRVTRQLCKSGIRTAAIHSDKAQGARQKALDDFKRGATRVLVASDIASRGIDVDDITHVFNYDLPNEAETYVHRIGRTGRAGSTGRAISFCIQEQRKDLEAIERLIGKSIPVLTASVPRSAPHSKDESPRERGADRPTRKQSRDETPERPKRTRSREDRDGSRPEAADAASPSTVRPKSHPSKGPRPRNVGPRGQGSDRPKRARSRDETAERSKPTRSRESEDRSQPRSRRDGDAPRSKGKSRRPEQKARRDPNSRWPGSPDYKPDPKAKRGRKKKRSLVVRTASPKRR